MVEDIKLNVKKGTYEDMQEHYGEIGDKDFCLVEGKDVPIPFAEDAGKIIGVDNEGKYTLINPPSGGSISAVTINSPSSATNGTLSTEDLALLQANDLNYINFANEIYKLNDKQTDLGWLVYSHIGQDTQGQFFVKCIVITILTRAWVLNTLQLSGQ